MLIKHYWLFRRKAKKIISSAFMHHRQEMNLSAKFSQATEKKNQCEKLFRKRNIRIRFRVPLEIIFFQWRHCKYSKNTLRVKLFGCSPQPSINVIKLWQWLLIYYTKNAPKGAWNWEDSCVWRHILLLFIIADEVIITLCQVLTPLPEPQMLGVVFLYIVRLMILVASCLGILELLNLYGKASRKSVHRSWINKDRGNHWIISHI